MSRSVASIPPTAPEMTKIQSALTHSRGGPASALSFSSSEAPLPAATA